MKRDGACTSIWQSENFHPGSNKTDQQKIYDVIVIGAGITGVTTALLLQQAGKSCLLAEAVNPGFGTSGGTTAHLNTFYDTTYSQIIKDFGEENAVLAATGAKAAINFIKNNIAGNNIDCTFEEKNGYLFSLDEKQDKQLEEIVTSANKAGVQMKFTDQNPFGIPYIRVALIPGQAQFNPIQYIHGLLSIYQSAGGVLIENCRVQEIKEGEVLSIQTSQGEIKALNAIYATHIPPGINILHLRCAPYRSYALGLKLIQKDYPGAVGYDMEDPYHYYRTQVVEGQKFMIVGGEDHKTGHESDTESCFKKLESHAREHFDVEAVTFKWSSQYFEPADGLPYIGHLPGNGDNIYVATGFGGNGMIYGTLSAIILSDILVKGKSIYKELFDPGRIKPVAGFGNFVKEGADVVKSLVGKIFPAEKLKELSEVEYGQAKIVKYEGHVIGIYKDDKGEIYAVNSSCPHIKCTVNWNTAEKSWDCPCHGSRFGYEGNLLTAPAVKGLEKVDVYVKE